MKPFRMLNLSAEETLAKFTLPQLPEIPENCRFLEVGAGEGHYSIEAAMRGLIVKAVEWDPVQAIILDANIKLNGNPDIRVVRQVPVGVAAGGLLGNQRTINQLTTGWDHWAILLGNKSPIDELLSYPNWLQIADVVIYTGYPAPALRDSREEILTKAGFRIDRKASSMWMVVAKRSNLSLDV